MPFILKNKKITKIKTKIPLRKPKISLEKTVKTGVAKKPSSSNLKEQKIRHKTSEIYFKIKKTLETVQKLEGDCRVLQEYIKEFEWLTL